MFAMRQIRIRHIFVHVAGRLLSCTLRIRKNKMVISKSLPNFSYKKPESGRTRSGKQYLISEPVTCTYGKITIFPQFTSEMIFDRQRWRTAGKYSKVRPPRGWPKHLKWPRDVDKASLLKWSVTSRCKPKLSSATNYDFLRGVPNCSAQGCSNPKPTLKTKQGVCKCTEAPWEYRKTQQWMNKHIELRWIDEKMGIGTIARTAFPAGTVIGEYLGELVPAQFEDETTAYSPYLYDVIHGNGKTLACIDALRVGSWTRFINHSCKPNVAFENRRVGAYERACVVVVEELSKGTEILIDYGSPYWNCMRKRGIFCCCGQVGCRYRRKV